MLLQYVDGRSITDRITRLCHVNILYLEVYKVYIIGKFNLSNSFSGIVYREYTQLKYNIKITVTNNYPCCIQEINRAFFLRGFLIYSRTTIIDPLVNGVYFRTQGYKRLEEFLKIIRQNHGVLIYGPQWEKMYVFLAI